MGFPDFNNDGKVSVGEGLVSLQMLGFLEDSDQDSSPGGSGGPDGSCCGCIVAILGVMLLFFLVGLIL